MLVAKRLRSRNFWMHPDAIVAIADDPSTA